MNLFLKAPSGDAYENLARDEFLLNELAPETVILYLYVNNNAVIIGRNQNPRMECNLDKLNEDKVQLVRRISGGGAVYHDAGNLNYSFIASADLYDESRQTGVILKALAEFGIRAEVSGRNDITADGLKFSGNAFCARGDRRQHHGTLLIRSDLSVFASYLTPSKQKLASKGIQSVRSRVCNLSELNPDVTVASMADALRRAFEAEYGPAREPVFSAEDERKIADLRLKHVGWEWLMGETPRFDVEIDRRVAGGNAVMRLSVQGGVITDCTVYTDALDIQVPQRVRALLIGARYDDMETILGGMS